MLRLLKFVRKRVALFFYGTKGLGNGELPRDLTGIELGLQPLDLGVLSPSLSFSTTTLNGINELET